MSRLRMPAAMPADIAERLSDIYVEPPEFCPWDDMHIRAVVPYDLAPAIQRILELEGCTAEAYEEARAKLLKACIERWRDI